MAITIPRKKENHLIESINSMINDAVINNDRLDEILAEAKKMQEIGGEYYDSAKRIMGMVAALKGDVKEVDIQFNAAIKHGGRTVETLDQYATVLWNLSQYRRSLILLDEAARMEPDSIEIIRAGLRHHLAVVDVDGAHEFLQKAINLNAIDEKEKIKAMNDIDASSKVLRDTNVSWEAVCERFELVSSVIAKSGLNSLLMQKSIVDGAFYIEHSVGDCDINEVMATEEAIGHAIANMPFSPVDMLVSFSCVRV